ncbi:MAG: TlpA disulfide reductase family protein, partial [Candidatus Krumholzibacteriia bacterium]
MRFRTSAAPARVLMVVLVVLVVPGAGRHASAGDEPSQLVGGSVKSILEGLHLEDVDGRRADLSSYLGTGPVVLDFWATWCKPCLAAFPELNELYEDLEPRGLQVVGINEDGPRNASKIKPFMKSHGYTFPVVL